MKNAAWWKEARAALPTGFGQARHSRVAYVRPVRWVLHGVLGETTSASTIDYYLWLVRTPLYSPNDGLDLSWSDRLGSGASTYTLNTSEGRQAIRHAGELAGIEAAADEFPNSDGWTRNLLMRETRAYGLVIAGDVGGAYELLKLVAEHDARYPWQEAMVGRASGMQRLLDGGDATQALEQLRVWRRETALAVGLDLADLAE
jgi:hypothetical protein